ncbi:hypothetical protein QP415_12190, partial [Pauljensenia sp. UMB3104]|nr:hypothetical protein [Pauljensenia sp. UMB3104]
QRADRNLADTEYLMREIAGLRDAVGDMATRDFVRSELRDLLHELDDRNIDRAAEREERIRELQEELDAVKAQREARDVPVDPGDD